ncbi:hypothetical protein [Nocardioides sp. Root151]|uniref:hypothetical protein n=1 Tax=Nocardioides sp. Root151 TaxID=1736475 RepID=UPI000702D17B|nr:hypothetical protein [Nocardioides sp. Root151]KQZ67033.1 hypothetical protein ASD66_18745 [Nocardioides sp. Root151]
MNGRQIGGLIGAGGGLVFVLANAGELPGATALRVVGVACFVVLVAWLVVRTPAAPPTPTPAALRIYWTCVLGELVAIPAGAAVLRQLGHAELVPAWVLLVVGTHFVPFAQAFRLPLFARLGLVLIAIALAGMASSLAGVDDAVPLAAVAAGFVLFAAVAVGSLQREATAVVS